MSKSNQIPDSKRNFVRRVVEKFFDGMEFKGYVDEVRLGYDGSVWYHYNNLGLASLHGNKLYLSCYYRPTYGLLERYEEIAKAVKERYGIDVSIFAVDKDLIIKIGGTTYIFFGYVVIDLKTKQVVENTLTARVYTSDDSVERIADVSIGNSFTLTLGLINNEIVVKLTRYDIKTIKAISLKLRFQPPFDPRWLTLYWIPLADKKIQVEDTLEMLDKNARAKLDAVIKQLKQM